MALDKTDFVGAHVVDSDAKVNYILRSANNRGQQYFDAAQAYAGTAATLPTPYADMQDTYTLDAAAVDVVLQGNGGGARGHEFLTAMTLSALGPGGTIDKAAGTPSSPAVLTFTGLWLSGTTANLTIVSDPGAVSTAFSYTFTQDAGPQTAASLFAKAITAQLGHAAGLGGQNGLCLIVPVDPTYTDVTISLFSAS